MRVNSLWMLYFFIAAIFLGICGTQAKRACLRRSTDNKVLLLPATGSAPHGERQLYRCTSGLQAHGVEFSDAGYSYVLCDDGKWSPKPQCVGALNRCLRAATNSDVAFLPAGGHARSGDMQLYHCPSGFNARGIKFSAREYSYVVCNDGHWDPQPDCVGNPCERVNTTLVKFPQRGFADHGHRQLYKCAGFSRTVSNRNHAFVTCNNGTWSPRPRCFPRGCLNGFEKFDKKYCAGEALFRNWMKKPVLDCTNMCNNHERCKALQHDGNYCKMYEECKLTTAYYNTYTVYIKTEQCKPQ